MTTGALTSWKDGPAKDAIVASVCAAGGGDGAPAVPPEERLAVFDNDGTLWCEKPMPIQLDYIASGGGRDFMRPISHDVYGIPRQRVIGSATALAYTSGAESALERAHKGGWTIVSMKNDWTTIF